MMPVTEKVRPQKEQVCLEEVGERKFATLSHNSILKDFGFK